MVRSIVAACAVLCLSLLLAGHGAAQNRTAAGQQTGAAQTQQVADLVPAEELKNLDIALDGQEVEIENLLMDPASGKIAFAVIGEGGWLGTGEDRRLVPWSALSLTRDDEGEPRFALAEGVSYDPAKAPRYDAERGVLSGSDMAAAYQAYGMDNEIVPLREQCLAQAKDLGRTSCNTGWGQEAGLVEIQRIVNTPVRNEQGEDLGVIDRVLVDPQAGMAVLAVLNTSDSFFWWVDVTTNTETYVFPWQAFSVEEGTEGLTLALGERRLDQSLLVMQDDVELLDLNDAADIYNDWGMQAYWESEP